MKPLLISACLLLVSDYSLAIERVISLAPSSTEIAYAAGLGGKMIAASVHSDYPEEAKRLEHVAAYSSINIERIIALNPDLIVAWKSGGSGNALSQLKDLGYKIFYTDTDSLSDIATRIEELSEFSDAPEKGKNRAKQFRDELGKLRKQYQGSKKVSFFYQISGRPIYTLAQSAWPGEVFELCGGVNVFKDTPAPYPQVSFEEVLVRAPEVIFTSAHATQNTEQWMAWEDQIPAVANQAIWSLNADWINRPTPRSLNAVREVCNYLDRARE
ncbi:vitamin B12 ABC transporter substrate-binding protein BtuF [Vibrio sp. JC009]|uniref:vitamin B12 ABC transporter substrate-binding protein BtuF n=1 Tax=Vibrio sp. JC009 TaxID=2912314 RepID=UPI0023B0B810|nr:vitamin B12 ABC transporter substrate-binding protein BtuF [Vibrio sp. JC009]WED22327.1 vitamin B12 ABC transporter substrate-binding protein BtuF [Vibrio sp. JC009]